MMDAPRPSAEGLGVPAGPRPPGTLLRLTWRLRHDPRSAPSAPLVTTVLALTLLLSFKTPGAPRSAARTAPTGDPGHRGRGHARDDARRRARHDDRPATAARPTARPRPTAHAGADRRPRRPATGDYADGTVTGDVISTRYGDVQVQVTISGGADHRRHRAGAAARDGRSLAISAGRSADPARGGADGPEREHRPPVRRDLHEPGYDKSLQSALDQAAG